MKYLFLLLLASSAHAYQNIEPQDLSFSTYNVMALSIATTTPPTTAITVYGIIASSTTSPTVTCNAGTGVMIAGSTSQSGSFTAGSLAVNCTVTFSVPFPKTPLCLCQVQTTPVAIAAVGTTTTVKCTAVASLSGDTLNYFCWGPP